MVALGISGKCFEVSILLSCLPPAPLLSHRGEESEPYKFLVCPLGVGGSWEAGRAVSASVCY